MIGASYHSIIVYKQQPENEINLNNTKAHLTSAFLLQQPFVFFTLYFFASWDIFLKAELEISLFTWSQSTQLHQTKSFDISQCICPFCPAIHLSLHLVAVENIIRGKARNCLFKETDYLLCFQCLMPAPACNTGTMQWAQTSPTYRGMQQDLDLLGFRMVPEQTSSLWAFKKNENQLQPPFPQKPPLSSSNPSYHTEDPCWESHGTELTFRKQRGVSCGSGAIPGCHTVSLPPHHNTDPAVLFKESRPVGNSYRDLSGSVF